jgi:hypothetical protein
LVPEHSHWNGCLLQIIIYQWTELISQVSMGGELRNSILWIVKMEWKQFITEEVSHTPIYYVAKWQFSGVTVTYRGMMDSSALRTILQL